VRVLAFAALCAAWAPSALAQTTTAGRIVRLVGNDTIPAHRVQVVLHRVGPAGQGPLDTMLTDPAGRFGFRFAADTASVFLLSARYAGIEYFSRPVSGDPGRADTSVTLIVADTSSEQPVAVRQRTLLVSRPDESGTRVVIDWLVLSNRGPRTRVAPDSLRPVWGGPLPEAAQNVEMADSRLSQFAAEAVSFRRDSALIFAPLSPGDKELMLQYRIPGPLRKFVVPASVSDSVFVLLEEPGARVTVPRLMVVDSQVIEGRPFYRWAGSLGGAGDIEILLAGPRFSQQQLLMLLVTLLGAGFALLAGRAIIVARRRRGSG